VEHKRRRDQKATRKALTKPAKSVPAAQAGEQLEQNQPEGEGAEQE
jgi:hypothetical protein